MSRSYHAETGDVVVGRVVEVAQSRWRLDVNSRQHASLLLSSVNLTGTLQQRRRTQLDELEMRKYFRENDVVSVSDRRRFVVIADAIRRTLGRSALGLRRWFGAIAFAQSKIQQGVCVCFSLFVLHVF